MKIKRIIDVLIHYTGSGKGDGYWSRIPSPFDENPASGASVTAITNIVFFLASSLRASSPRRSGGGAGKGKRACNYVSGIWIPPSITLRLPVDCQITANQLEAETSANVNKLRKIRAKGNDAITSVISAKQHFASLFSMQIIKFQRRSCKISFLFAPHRQSAPESLLVG